MNKRIGFIGPTAAPRSGARAAGVSRAPKRPEAFKEFAASELYCPKCQMAMPVREKQLLYLPTGGAGIADYRCSKCGTVLGTRREP